jgi:hypothetical protein
VTHSNDTPLLTQIKVGLRPLLPDGEVLEGTSVEIEKTLSFLNGPRRLPDSSELFDFSGKITQIARHFAADGLTKKAYLQAAVKQPPLFAMNPVTVIGNIERVADYFASDGLTRKAYLQAAVKQPSLFYQKAETIIGNIERVAEHFSADDLTRKAYIQAAIKQPPLFAMNSRTIIGNIERVAEHFSADGLTRKVYIQVVVRQPSLFSMKPDTVISHLEGVTDYFAANGLTRKAYIQAAIKQPPLFAMNPETVIGHVNLLTDLNRRGLLDLPESTRGPPRDARPVLTFMLKEPVYFCLADDNFALRELHAHIVNSTSSPSLLRRTRRQIEDELAESLGHRDRNEPISKVSQEAGSDSHARNLLLRALIREGWIKGRLQL